MQAIAFGRLALLLTFVDGAAYAPDALERRRDDPAFLAAEARLLEGAVERARVHGAVLPMRLLTVFAHPETLEEGARDQYARWSRGLARLGTKRECVVHVYAGPHAPPVTTPYVLRVAQRVSRTGKPPTLKGATPAIEHARRLWRECVEGVAATRRLPVVSERGALWSAAMLLDADAVETLAATLERSVEAGAPLGVTAYLEIPARAVQFRVSAPTVAVLAGDGIGVEVTAVAERILARVRPDCSFEHGLVGAAALDAVGTPFPDATRDLCERSAAVLFGAVGDPRYDGASGDRRPEYAILQLRKHFDLFANLRPVAIIAGLESASSLKPEFVRALDLVVVRETTSGLYFGEPKYTREIDGVETAVDTLVYRAPEIERIARVAFELARRRRKRVTSVDKQNVLESGRLWRRVVVAVHAAEYGDVALDHLFVDNAAMQLVRDPQRFDVLLTENTFGDILSDEAGMLTGSLGNLPSATLGAREDARGRFGLYEPISGSAPDIAGTDAANPIAAILSAALLCRYSLGDEPAAARIEAAVASAIAGGARTRDIARGSESALGTIAFGERVLAELG